MQLEAVVDDGEVLAPVTIEPFVLDEVGLRAWDLDVALKTLEGQLQPPEPKED